MTSNQDQAFYQAGIRFYLPEDSRLPLGGQSQWSPQCRQALTGACETAAQLYKQLERRVVTLPYLTSEIGRLGGLVSQAHTLLQLELLSEAETIEIGTCPVWDVASGVELPDSVLVDRIFNARRLSALSLTRWAYQISETCCYLLQDLPFAILSIDEVAAILYSIHQMFSRLVKDGGIATSERDKNTRDHDAMAVTVSDFLATHDQLTQAWQTMQRNDDCVLASEEQDAWQRNVVFYRWQIGHHFFFLCVIYGRDALAQAAGAFAEGAETCAAQALMEAGGFLRGSTAAMWYASNFTAECYQTQIRPYLHEVGPPGGPSGTMMFDYEQLKQAKEEVRQLVLARYGKNTHQWPPVVRQSMQNFYEIYIEDMEQHILLAASKVGIDTSLSQKVWQADLPDSFVKGHAIDVLRTMTALRRAEIKF